MGTQIVNKIFVNKLAFPKLTNEFVHELETVAAIVPLSSKGAQQ